MNEWSNLFVATSGAAAALTGLIFVGISINLEKILKTPNLPNRALISLILLLSILIISLLFLIPGQSVTAISTENISVGCLVWLINTKIDFGVLQVTPKSYKKSYRINMFVNQVAILFYIAGGIVMLLEGGAGMILIMAAIIISFIKSVIDAWVLLIEINR